MAAFERNLEFETDLGIDCIRVDSVSPPDVFQKEKLDPQLGWERLTKTFRAAAQKAADRGIRVVWEFEPGFAFNKPSEILRMPSEVDHGNFRVLYDTCHAHMCAVVGARQPGEKETLPGGALELLTRLRGQLGHVHLIDSDGTPHNNETSTHAPFGEGVVKFDQILPEILRMPSEVDHGNFRVLYDTCHAHMCAVVGARQLGEKETLPGGALELLTRLRGQLGHVHLIDSDGTLHNNETSTHAPFGEGVVKFDQLLPEILRSGISSNWWTVDLCFWPNAWEATASAKAFLVGMAHKYAGQVKGASMPKPLSIGMVGYGFMGRAHSNAYLRVNLFFDLDYKPVLMAVAGSSVPP